jgi:acyl-CoA synthetase (NDP forming)
MNMAPTGPSTAGGSVFDSLVDARAIAIIGASSNPETLSGRPLGYLKHHGFAGRIYPVNPTRDEVQGMKTYPTISAIPEPVDAAMVAVRAELVPQALEECIAAGVKFAVVVSSGFGEGQGQGADLKASVEALLATTEMRIMGPNCEGLLSMPNAMPLTFSPVVDTDRTGQPLIPGKVAIISQSGGLGFAVAQWGFAVGLGFNYVLSTGNEIDIDAIELAEYLIERDDASVLVLLVEGFDRRERIAALGARARDLGKHIVAAKLGRSAAGVRAAYNHTRHDAGDPQEYQALFGAAGVHEAHDEEDLIDTIQILVKAPTMHGKRVAVVTTSGGAGVWLADNCEAEGLEIPILSDAIQAELATNMPGYGSPVNPVDLTAQFFAGGTFSEVIELLFNSGEVDAVVIVTSLASAGRLEKERDGLQSILARHAVPLVMFTYTNPAPTNVAILHELGIPWFDASGRAAKAVARLARAGGAEL